MSVTGAPVNTYDEVPYPSQPLPHSNPARLAAIGVMFGMQPPAVERARVLELGCGTGGNLIPLAERFPQARFVGLDYSQVQIEQGLRVVAQAGLDNIRLLHQSIADFQPEPGSFDYVLCHGVFSWVPPELQDRILEICRDALSPQGIAFVSYNIYPGWHLRSVTRELLCQHTRPDGSPAERLAQGRRLLEFFSAAWARQATPLAQVLKEEVDAVLKQPEGYVYHEYFETHNQAYYVSEFLQRTRAFGLDYLGDAAPATMFANNFGPDIERHVLSVSDDAVAAEQHLDVLRNRGFRQSLLCRSGVPLVRQLTPARLETLYLAGKLRPNNVLPDIKGPTIERFTSDHNVSISSPAPAMKAALLFLSNRYPRGATLADVHAGVEQMLGSSGQPFVLSADHRRSLGHNLVQCFASGLVDLTTVPDGFTMDVSERPLASRLARNQAALTSGVTNRRHELVQLDVAAREVLQRLDGQHDRDALVRALPSGATETAQAQVILLDLLLRKLASEALLIG